MIVCRYIHVNDTKHKSMPIYNVHKFQLKLNWMHQFKLLAHISVLVLECLECISRLEKNSHGFQSFQQIWSCWTLKQVLYCFSGCVITVTEPDVCMIAQDFWMHFHLLHVLNTPSIFLISLVCWQRKYETAKIRQLQFHYFDMFLEESSPLNWATQL